MMQAFRNSAKIVAAIFAVMLFLWLLDLSGVTSGTGMFSNTASVGKIEGQEIDGRTFQSAVEQATQQQQRGGAALSLEQSQQIRNQVWDQFVQTAVLNAEYQRRGITVTEDEVIDALKSSPPPELRRVPEFQTDSQFDMAKYQRWLVSGGATPYVEQLAAQYREELKRSKLLRVVTADVYVSEAALWESFRDQNEKVKIGLTAIVPSTVVPDSAVSVTDAEVEAYYKSHLDDFKRPATAYLSYTWMSRATDASDTAAAFDRAKAARQEIADGAPFADVAKRESADTASGSKGGELGEWRPGSFAPAFEAAAKALPVNALSEPVLTDFGYHIIQVTARKGDLTTGRHILIPIELAGAHRDRLDLRADSVEHALADQTTAAAFDQGAKTVGVQVAQANPVQQGSLVQIGNVTVPDAGVWAFEATPGQSSRVIETEFGFYVFRLDSVQAAGIPTLAQARAVVVHEAKGAKKWEKARTIAKDYLARVEAGQTLKSAAEAMQLPYREFGPFPRVDPPLTNPMVVGTAFGLDAGQRSGMLDTKDGLYVMEGLERTAADSGQFVKELEQQRLQTIRGAQQERVRNYLAALKDRAKITDNRERFYRGAAKQQS